ncbi:hypothetical protein EIK77_000364 [Talaromyces pinophilus]|nr:hypothetical protein EIK77_000364 [Talaromyces pinophilus]
MSCAASQRCLVQLLREPIRSRSVPTFLVPALSQPLRTQSFSTTSAARSRIGGAPVSIPPEVNLSLIDLPQTNVRGKAKDAPKMAVEVNGPLGQLTLNIPPFVNINHDQTARKATVSVQDAEIPHQRAMWVTAEFPGQQFVSLKVGYSHPIELPIPKGVKASTPQPTRILLESIDKEVVTQFAAEIREWRKPEPYKGKGIFVNGETIRLKNKKIK